MSARNPLRVRLVLYYIVARRAVPQERGASLAFAPASEKEFVMYELYERMGMYLGPFWLDVCGAAASAALAAAGIEPFWRDGRAAESLLKIPSDRAQGGQGERI